MNWYLQALKKYVDFGGRARRREYWYYVLFNLLIAFVLGFIDGLLGLPELGADYGLLGGIYALAVLLPSLAVSVRRLHDTGRSGWWLLIGLIPLLGVLYLLFCFIQESKPEENKYGPNPRAFTFAEQASA